MAGSSNYVGSAISEELKEDAATQRVVIDYKNNLPIVRMGIIDAGSNKRIVVDAHLDFASSKTIMPTYIANEMNLSFAGSDETVTGAGIIHVPYYEVTIEVFGRLHENVHVGCIDFPDRTPARALLGRDILDNYRICLDGRRKQIEVT
jgi:hypothetical protein